MAEPAVARRGIRAAPAAELLAAAAFLTRVPVPAGRVHERRTGGAAFGLVGAALGAIGAIPVVVVGAAHASIGAILALAILTILDGGLHLDGLADTVDALAAPGDRAEQARTDPRVGAAGVAGIALVLGLEAASLGELASRWPTAAAGAFVAAVTVSRAAAPVWALAVARFPARARGHLGGWFTSSTTTVQVAVAIVTTILVLLIALAVCGPGVLIGAVVGSATAVVLGGAVVMARRGLDGDGYGAIIELTVASVLVATAVLG